MAPSSLPFAPLMTLPFDRITALEMDPGGQVALFGRVTSSLDGSALDGARLFDFAAGGLRIVDGSPASAAYVLSATGGAAPACTAVGVSSPCLVPRLGALAHERLRTSEEFASTLSGSIELEARPAVGSLAGPSGGISEIVSMLTIVGVGVAAAIGVGWVALRLARRLAGTPMGRVRIAARRALRSTRGDATLERARQSIRALVERARQVDALRRSCAAKLARIDRDALDRRADAWACASLPGAAAALACVSAERDEAAQLERDHASAGIELERIESALRVVALRARTRREPSTQVDLVDTLVAELDFRDQAIAEVEAS
jgi:hypothetical protein